MRALLILALASCTHDITAFDQVDLRPARDLDILFVFDNSPDRGSYDQLESQLDVLQNRLMEIDGQLPSLRVGVVTTDLGTRGSLDPLPSPAFAGCAGDGNAANLVTFNAAILGSYLEDRRGPDGTRQRNFPSDDLALEIGRLTNPARGTVNNGCEFEQPLEAMRRALGPNGNPGFLREGAMLSVVFLTTEDDCSFARGSLLDPANGALGPLTSFRCTEQGVICDGDDPRTPGMKTNCRPRDKSPFMVDVADYQKFLEGLKPDKRDITVSAVAGPPTPFAVDNTGVPTLAASCQGPGGFARPAVRLGALVNSFGGAMVDGCSQESAYQQITAPIVAPQRSCFQLLRKDDGEDCSVVEIAGATRTEIARCGGSSSPCWYTYTDPALCPGGENIGIAIRRGNTTAAVGSHIEATCFGK